MFEDNNLDSNMQSHTDGSLRQFTKVNINAFGMKKSSKSSKQKAKIRYIKSISRKGDRLKYKMLLAHNIEMSVLKGTKFSINELLKETNNGDLWFDFNGCYGELKSRLLKISSSEKIKWGDRVAVSKLIKRMAKLTKSSGAGLIKVKDKIFYKYMMITAALSTVLVWPLSSYLENFYIPLLHINRVEESSMLIFVLLLLAVTQYFILYPFQVIEFRKRAKASMKAQFPIIN